MTRTLAILAICVAAGPAFASQTTIHEISDVTQISQFQYAFHNTSGVTVLAQAAPASMAAALMSAGAMSQDYSCSFSLSSGGAHVLEGCNATGEF